MITKSSSLVLDEWRLSYFSKIALSNNNSPFFITDISPVKTEPIQATQELTLKSSDTLRLEYMQKLLNMPPSNATNSLIIFDWDDTLFCTSHITPGGFFDDNIKLTTKELAKMAILEQIVISVLKKAISLGDVYIVTNATDGWVEYSTQRFFPKLEETLQKVEIISARALFDQAYPRQSKKWKLEAFRLIGNRYKKSFLTNIVALGDSPAEMEAASDLGTLFKQAFVKTVKFREHPRLEELIKQCTLVKENLGTIYGLLKNQTIKVERKNK